MMLMRLCLVTLLCAPLAARAAQPAPAMTMTMTKPFVMLISIDGLKPEAVLEADQHGLKLPNLRALLADGSYANAVRGVLPTLTYPSHMTILTGASPARHGIFANTTFDPLNRNERGWYWYAEDVRTATLWDAAAAAHLTTANVYWPTSVGAHITYNLPQIWRTGTADDLKLQRALETPGLERQLSATLTGLDTEQHHSGPFSAPSNAVLERLDALVGQLRAAAEKAAPHHATICVVSDHGFANVAHDVNLYGAFLGAGFFSVGADHQISSWKAMLWPAGGKAAVMLADPDDQAVRAKVADLLRDLAADPENGIERIWTHDEIAADRGFPQAAFLVAFKVGYEIAYAFTPPLVTAPANLGMHGYPPEYPEMHSSFFLVGPGVPAAHALGLIDMRQIAPTLAKILRAPLPDAELAPLTLN